MNRTMPRWVRLTAGAVLRFYPADFRREWGAAWTEAAEDRWRRMSRRADEGVAAGWASLRFVGFLLADAARAAPPLWRARVGWTGDAHGRAGAVERTGTTREGGAMGWIESWLWDGRVAVRSLARRPALGALVVGTLGLGIGANAAIFGVLDRVVLNPFPFEGGDRMAYVVDTSVETGFSVSPTQEELETWREGARTLERIEVLRGGGGTLTTSAGHLRVSGLGVSGGLPSMVGLRPVLGRAFAPGDAEPGAEPVVMLHEDFWRSAFGGDAGVLGRTLTLNEKALTVIGVWPRDARLRVESSPDLYQVLPRGEEMNRAMFTQALALLRPGVAPEDVEGEMNALSTALDREAGRDPSRYRPELKAPHEYLGSDFARGLWILFVGGALLLVGASANAASLLLNRAVDREGELGVRLALGGSNRRLLRSFLLEGGLLAAGGAALGLALAQAGGAALSAVAPEEMPGSVLSGVGGRVPLYALALVAATALACAGVPALHLRSPAVRRLLTARGSAGREKSLLRPTLIAAQVTLALVLLVASALTTRSFRALHTADPGFALEEMVTVSVRAPSSGFPSEADRAGIMADVEAALQALPGVRGVDASGTSLLSYSMTQGEPRLEGDGREIGSERLSASTGAEEDFFDVLGIPVLEGRGFTLSELESEGPRVIVVNEVFARRYPEGVLGRNLFLPGQDPLPYRIVGVVGDVKAFSLEGLGEQVQYYIPDRWRDRSDGWARFNLRVEGDPARVLALARERVRSLDSDLVVTESRTGRDVLRAETEEQRFLALLLVVFGGLSLALAVGGIYGAISLQVTRRTRELGIRIALGADRSRVVREVVLGGAPPVMAGALVGVGAATLLSPYLEAVLYEVSPIDPVSFGAGALVLLAAASAALLVPARRATRVEPREALRVE